MVDFHIITADFPVLDKAPPSFQEVLAAFDSFFKAGKADEIKQISELDQVRSLFEFF